MLPTSLHEVLHAYLEYVRQWHDADLANGYGEAPLPDALARKPGPQGFTFSCVSWFVFACPGVGLCKRFAVGVGG